MVTVDAAASPTTADAVEEIPGMTADAGTETATGMTAGEGLLRSRHPEALADARKRNPDPTVMESFWMPPMILDV